MKFNQQLSQAMTNSLPTNYSNSKKNENSRLNNKKTPIKKSAKENEEALTEEKNPLHDIVIKDSTVTFNLKKADSDDSQELLAELLKTIQENAKLDKVSIIYKSVLKDLHKLSPKDEQNLILILNLKQIKILVINSVHLSKNAFKEISKILKHDDNLIGLELNAANLAQNVKYLAKILTKNTHLKELKLINNNLNDEDLIGIGFAVSKNKCLEGLQIEYEVISDLTVDVLVNNIIKNKKLYKLILKNNNVDTIGIEKIINAIKKTCVLDNIKLISNNLSSEQQTEIDRLTKSNIEINKGNNMIKDIDKAIAKMQEHYTKAIKIDSSRAEFIPPDAMKYLPVNFVENTVEVIGAGATVEGN